MTSPGTAEQYYRESQQAILELVTPENQDLIVPATPLWSLRDLVSHLAGVMQDFLSGNLEGAPGPEWTAAQVDRFRDSEFSTVVQTWLDLVDRAEPVFKQVGVRLLPDIVTHEFDARGALGNSRARDSDRLFNLGDVFLRSRSDYYRKNVIPAIELSFNGISHVLGDGTPAIVLNTTAFELSRVLSGRRSEAQIRAMDWSADPSDWLVHLSPFGIRASDLIEYSNTK